ncbi:hypothetical protein [Terrabacter sp. C0L_2]|uniref:hypothetical protein n=1 Tax=Terrabacter sp. C0L_2 TaxID=3108389 RepID=UPI002ED47408|nr:hypothetical protein U5C87_17650 [Terrabacter sp. C0L_2]
MSNTLRRDRYVRAIFCGEDGGVGEAALYLVMAVADAEQAELRAEVERLRSALRAERGDD